MALMKLVEIADSASALGNQLRAGIPIAEATGRLPSLQPSYAEFWEAVTRSIEAGRPLSSLLPQVWPEALVMAVIAGEESGKLDEVLEGVQAAIQIQVDQQNNFKKLLYPVVIILLGLAIFTSIMVFVVPLTTSSFASVDVNSTNGFTELSEWMVYVFNNYWLGIAIALVVGGITFFKWVTSEDGKNTILNILFGVPVIGMALRDMFFGVWARYMALMASAGIETSKGLIITSRVMPERLRHGILAFERDITVNSRSMAHAADPKKQAENDPRRDWPFYISTAFITAAQTEEIDRELLRVAPSLINEAVKKFNRAMFIANLVAMVIGGALLAVSFSAIYVPLFSAISHAH